MTTNAAFLDPLSLLLFLLVAIVLLVGIVLFFQSARFKGYAGERRVRGKLESLVRSDKEYYPFHDVVLKTPDGSTQVDHILISPYGIFVIETKNLKGWIFGDVNAKKWTQSLYRKKFRFQNPLHQNFKHVKAVQNLLGLNIEAIYSAVVFVGNSEFRTMMPENVLELGDFLPYIRSYTERILDNNSIDSFVEQLRSSAYNDSDIGRSHVQSVKQNKTKPVCPRCGKPMVLRTARKGRNAGTKFWGCSGFPICKAIKDVA